MRRFGRIGRLIIGDQPLDLIEDYANGSSISPVRPSSVP